MNLPLFLHLCTSVVEFRNPPCFMCIPVIACFHHNSKVPLPDGSNESKGKSKISCSPTPSSFPLLSLCSCLLCLKKSVASCSVPFHLFILGYFSPKCDVLFLLYLSSTCLLSLQKIFSVRELCCTSSHLVLRHVWLPHHTLMFRSCFVFPSRTGAPDLYPPVSNTSL